MPSIKKMISSTTSDYLFNTPIQTIAYRGLGNGFGNSTEKSLKLDVFKVIKVP